MWGFLIGAIAGGLALNNKEGTARGVASTIVAGEKVVKNAATEVSRIAMQIAQDVQDIKEEQKQEEKLRAEAAAASPEALSALLEEIERLRASVETLKAERPAEDLPKTEE